MTVVADVVAMFRADTSDLDSAIQKSTSGIDGMHDSAQGLNEHFDKASGSVGDVSAGAAEAGGAFDVLAEKAEGVGSAVKGMVAGAVGVAGFAGLLDMAKNATSEMQTLSVQFNSTFGGSGQADLKQAVSLANELGTSIGAAASAYQQFGLATKGSNQDMSKDMKAFGDTAAATGSSIDQVSASVGGYYEAIQRLGSTSGTRYATSLLTSHVIDQTTYNKLHVEAGAGDSPQEQLNTILADMQKQYNGAGEAQSKTLGGQIQVFQNQFSEGAASAASPIMKSLTSGLGDVNKAMDSSGFKTATTDISEFVGVLVKGVAALAPFVEDIVQISMGLVSFVDHIGPAKLAVEGLVAAFVLIKAVNLASSLLPGVSALGQTAAAEVEVKSATDITTAAIVQQTLAVRALATAMAEQSGISLTSVGRGTTGLLGPDGLPVAATTATEEAPSLASRFMGSRFGPTIAGAGIALGGMELGHAIGGPTGTMISAASAGAGIGTMFGPEGTAVGAAAGLVVGAFQTVANASAQLSAGITKAAGSYQADHPVGTSLAQVTSSYHAAQQHANTLNQQANQYGGGLGDSLHREATESLAPYKSTFDNLHTNISHIRQQVPGLSTSGAESLAKTSGIDLTASYSANAEAIRNATTAVNQFGGAAQITAEALSSKAAQLGGIVGGNFGEGSVSIVGSEKQAKLSPTQIAFQAALSGINPQSAQYGGGGPNAINLNSTQSNLTPTAAGEINQNTSVQEQLKQATFGVTQAQWGLTQAYQGVQQATFALGQAQFAATQATFQLGQANFAAAQSIFQVTQAQFSLTQAYFSAWQAVFSLNQATIALGQAQFSVAQATFQLGQATLQAHVANISAVDSTNALATALSSGYVPNNYDAAASVTQLTTATSSQISAYMSLVTANQALQASFFPMQQTMTALQAAATQASDSIKTFQLQLQAPLQGSGAYAASHEATTVQGAAIQEQIDNLELQRVPTSDPRIQILQSQLAKVNAMGDVQTQINTQTIGLQQFQIQQAQLAPETSFSSQLGAAQGIGEAQKSIIDTQTAVDNLQPSFDKLSAAMTLSDTLTSAATSAIDATAAADQKNTTAANAVTTAQNAVTQANNGVVTASNAVTVAENNVTTAANNITNAQNGLNTALNNEGVAQNAVAAALNNVATAANGINQAQIAVTNAEEGVTAAQENVQSATASMNEAVVTNSAQMNFNFGVMLGEMQANLTEFGEKAIATFQAMVLDQAITAAGAAGVSTSVLFPAMDEASKAAGGSQLSASDVNSILSTLSSLSSAATKTSFDTGGIVGSTGLATVHAGETVVPVGGRVTPQQVINEIALLGGSALQEKVGGALVNGIESNGDPTILAGGIGPAAGLFQFEPATWRSNGGGAYAPVAQDASWQDQVQVFLNATRGNHFGAWGPDLGYSGYGNPGPPLPGSPVARNQYANGGVVPGSAAMEVPAILHGGEIVLSNTTLEAIGLNAGGVSGLDGIKQLAQGTPMVQGTPNGQTRRPLDPTLVSTLGSQFPSTTSPGVSMQPIPPTVTPPSSGAPGTSSTSSFGSGGGNSTTTIDSHNVTNVTVGPHAMDLNITIYEGDGNISQTIQQEVTESVNDALNQVIAQWQGK